MGNHPTPELNMTERQLAMKQRRANGLNEMHRDDSPVSTPPKRKRKAPGRKTPVGKTKPRKKPVSEEARICEETFPNEAVKSAELTGPARAAILESMSRKTEVAGEAEWQTLRTQLKRARCREREQKRAKAAALAAQPQTTGHEVANGHTLDHNAPNGVVNTIDPSLPSPGFTHAESSTSPQHGAEHQPNTNATPHDHTNGTLPTPAADDTSEHLSVAEIKERMHEHLVASHSAAQLGLTELGIQVHQLAVIIVDNNDIIAQLGAENEVLKDDLWKKSRRVRWEDEEEEESGDEDEEMAEAGEWDDAQNGGAADGGEYQG